LARVKKLYEANGGASTNSICPGEEACEDFAAAAGVTREEKCENVCAGCHLLATKIQNIESVIGEDEAEIYIAEVEQVRRTRDSGAGLDLTTISFLTWRLLLIYDDAVEAYERDLRLYAKALFEALAARGT